MRNKFRLKNKLVSMALALLLAAQPLASFPMNVFAGTGKHGAPTATRTKTEKVTVPVPTTITVPLTGIVKGTYNTDTNQFTFSEAISGSVPLPGTVKLGNTIISPSTVTIKLSLPSTVTFTVPTGNISFELPVNFTVGNAGPPAFASGTLKITDTQMSTSPQIHIFTVTFTQQSGDAVTFTVPNSVGNSFASSGDTVSLTYKFTGNLSFPAELMFPVDVTATVTDDKIDIQATASPQPQPQPQPQPVEQGEAVLNELR